MKNLLKKLEVIDFKYQILRDADTFNLFEILRKKNDEVNLHSKFIAELLNPKGTHGQGEIFLRLFLDCLGCTNCDISDKTTVESEKNIGKVNEDKTEGGRIDIIIEHIGKCHDVVIENKIYARDQKNQLLRYYNYNPNSKIYYLTLFGNEPSGYSLGGVAPEKVTHISYREDINNWLTLCIEKSAIYPPLREALLQYQKLVNKLTGNNMEEREEILKLLSEDENILLANKVVKNWKHVRWRTEFDFWTDFSKLIEETKKYKIMKEKKFSREHIKGVVYENSNPWYGIMFKITDFSGYEICLLIERTFGDVCYGVTAINGDGNRNINNDTQLEGIVASLKEKTHNFSQKEWWLCRNYLDPQINFAKFSNKNTLLLLNKSKREEYLKNIWDEIQKFIVEVKEVRNVEVDRIANRLTI